MGSANINDRSQQGDRDSEIALVVEDTDMVTTTMDGKPYMAARFAASLRRKLYRGTYIHIQPKL
jgi:phospholipase D1/2